MLGAGLVTKPTCLSSRRTVSQLQSLFHHVSELERDCLLSVSPSLLVAVMGYSVNWIKCSADSLMAGAPPTFPNPPRPTPGVLASNFQGLQDSSRRGRDQPTHREVGGALGPSDLGGDGAAGTRHFLLCTRGQTDSPLTKSPSSGLGRDVGRGTLENPSDQSAETCLSVWNLTFSWRKCPVSAGVGGAAA